MAGLSADERECLGRYLTLLEQQLGSRLVEVRMFGSAARGDMWPASSPMHSDIDLLVITRDVVSDTEEDELVSHTYPLFLECGRQISPHFSTSQQLAEPGKREFAANLARDAVRLWPAPAGQASA